MLKISVPPRKLMCRRLGVSVESFGHLIALLAIKETEHGTDAPKRVLSDKLDGTKAGLSAQLKLSHPKKVPGG